MWLFNRNNGESGFSSTSTAEEVTHGIDGSSLTAIVTGASSGIGAETSRVLALRGVHVIMAVRNIAAGNGVKEAIVKEVPAAKVDIMELDLSSLASVRKCAADFISSGHSLNMLINNAGVVGIPFMLSKDNIELQFATNHLGHFLLTNLLLNKMEETTCKTKREGRIVNVSSVGYCIFTYREGIRFDRISDPKSYSSFWAYGQSKLANILHTYELTRRLKEEGVEITANSLHPGVITTNMFRHLGIFDGFVSKFGKFIFKNVQQGASTTCYVALHPQLRGVSGEYFSDNNLATMTALAKDADLAKRLWDFSMDLVKNGASGFSSSSTAEEVTHGIDGSGLTAIVTGASSGIGAETSRVLALRGVHVIMAVRNIAAAEDVKETIVKEIPAAKVDIMELDLSSLASVRKFAADFISSGHSLNMLINNAGVSGIPFILSKDNIELQFATNHLGHFLLTNLLLDKMKETTRKTKREGRIVNVSSGAYRVFTYREGIRFDKINDPESYGRFTAYGQSKLANILHTCELTRRLKEGGVEITANSIHPGAVATNVFRNLGVFDGLVSTFGKFFFKTVQQGASTTCYVALHPQLKGISGEFFMGNNLATRTAIARDMDLAKRLWDFSMDLVK